MPKELNTTPKKKSNTEGNIILAEGKENESAQIKQVAAIKQAPAPSSRHTIKSKSKDNTTHNASIVTSVGGIKFVSMLSYLVFFLPLIFCRHEPYAIFHANQSLVLWLVMSLLYIIAVLASWSVFVLLVIIIFHTMGIFFGMYNALHNRARHFWGAGKFNLFKP